MGVDTQKSLSRRAVFGALSTGVGAAVLAACGANQSASPSAIPSVTPGPSNITNTPVAASIPGAGLIGGPLPGEAKSLNGAGASFPAALYSKWFNEYNRLTGVQVNYQSIGSGGGIKAISDQTVDFGASDAPMSDKQLEEAKGGEIFHIPTALGAVVATYNLPDMPQTARLKLNGDVLAGIFLNQIKKWNDPKIKELNAGVNLPDREIQTVHRSDGSGTTSIFTDYLSSVSAEWKEKVGMGTTVNWPSGLGAKGNEGIAGEVKANPYSIGYVELIYAIQNKLGVAQIKNKAGNFVEPNLETVTAAAEGVSQTIAPDLRASIVNADGAKSYPISGFTWILAYKEMKEEPKAIALTRMLWWATHDAQKFNNDLGYAPLPLGIIKKGEEKIKAISVNGKAAFPNK